MLNARLYNSNFEKNVFKIIETYNFHKHENCFGIAVSGGPDSMLLLHLLNKWVKKKKKELKFFSFNNNLRKNSENDLLLVKAACKKLNHQFYRINWFEKPKTAIMEKARIARYTKISELCKELRIKTLFTAHHADDIAETVSIRIIKKSNIEGLCPIFRLRELFNIKLFRPFTEIQKDEILKINRINKIEFANDPSNLDKKYLRANVRKYLKSNKEFKEQLIKASKLFCKIRKIIDLLIKRDFKGYFCYKNEGYMYIDISLFNKYPKFMLIYFLKYSLTRIGNKDYPPDGNQLNCFYNKCLKNDYFTITLCGCIISKNKGNLVIYRELKGIKEEQYTLKRYKEIVWDGRFKIYNKHHADILVYPLGKVVNSIIFKKFYKINKKKIKKLPMNIRVSLPVIKTLEGLMCIPHLNIYETKELIDNVKIHTIDFYDKKYDNIL